MVKLADGLEYMRTKQKDMPFPEECNVCGKTLQEDRTPFTLTAWESPDYGVGHAVAAWCSAKCVAKALGE